MRGHQVGCAELHSELFYLGSYTTAMLHLTTHPLNRTRKVSLPFWDQVISNGVGRNFRLRWVALQALWQGRQSHTLAAVEGPYGCTEYLSLHWEFSCGSSAQMLLPSSETPLRSVERNQCFGVQFLCSILGICCRRRCSELQTLVGWSLITSQVGVTSCGDAAWILL